MPAPAPLMLCFR